MEQLQGVINTHQRYKKRRIYLSISLGISTFFVILFLSVLYTEHSTATTIKTLSHQLIHEIDDDIIALSNVAQQVYPLLSQPCDRIEQRLQWLGALDPNLRSIMLVNKGHIYCSSTLGNHDIDITKHNPEVIHNKSKLRFISEAVDLGDRPLLSSWYPTDHQQGVLLSFDLQQLIRFQLQSDISSISQIVLELDNQAITGGKNIIFPRSYISLKNRYSQSSTIHPFTLHIYTIKKGMLLQQTLQDHAALAILLGLITTLITYFLSQKHFSVQNDLMTAIQRNEFTIKYQPIIQSNNLHCVGAEVLVRWQSANTVIPPDVFIPLIEEVGLIVPFTHYLMDQVTEELLLNQLLPTGFRISLNIGAEHLEDDRLLRDLIKLKSAIPSNLKLVVELTERTPVDVPAHLSQLSQIQDHNIAIAIDDFGSGHSSLSYLERMQPDYIKIDKDFIATIGTDAITSVVLDSMLALGKRLNIAIVAEGVETEEQINYLIDHGVQFLQGFYFSKPISIIELQDWLNINTVPLYTQKIKTTSPIRFTRKKRKKIGPPAA
ncbi:EAL domain-containing protein [Plesiomonas sp.]|uniref:EAL domain-containing protein n=1 Tax=Plesiomonas sp. TaxID=2486279 RepID=UPI003F329C18